MPYKEKPIKKIYFTIGEVSQTLKISKSKIRFWLKEFKYGVKKNNRERLFTEIDIKYLAKIKTMSIDGYTLKGIKRNLDKYSVDDKYYVKRIAR